MLFPRERHTSFESDWVSPPPESLVDLPRARLDREGLTEKMLFKKKLEGWRAVWSFRASLKKKKFFFKLTSAFAIFPEVFFKGRWVYTRLSTATLWPKVEKKLPGVSAVAGEELFCAQPKNTTSCYVLKLSSLTHPESVLGIVPSVWHCQFSSLY